MGLLKQKYHHTSTIHEPRTKHTLPLIINHIPPNPWAFFFSKEQVIVEDRKTSHAPRARLQQNHLVVICLHSKPHFQLQQHNKPFCSRHLTTNKNNRLASMPLYFLQNSSVYKGRRLDIIYSSVYKPRSLEFNQFRIFQMLKSEKSTSRTLQSQKEEESIAETGQINVRITPPGYKLCSLHGSTTS